MSVQIRALVIDDSRVMRNMVMTSLKKANLAEFEFVEAEDGKDALEKLNGNDIHIAFVDWNMPTMTGIDFVREVRAQEKRTGDDAIPLVMVTSEETMGKVQEALDGCGADVFISKPFTVEEFERKLKRVVERAKLVHLRRVRLRRELAQAEAPQPSGGLFGKLFG